MAPCKVAAFITVTVPMGVTYFGTVLRGFQSHDQRLEKNDGSRWVLS